MTSFNISSSVPDGWFEFIENSPYSLLYNTKPWHDVIVKTYPYYKPYYIYSEERGEITGCLPIFDVNKFNVHKVLSMPLSYGGPVVLENDFQTASGLISFFAKNLNFKASYKRISLPYNSPFQDQLKILENYGYKNISFNKMIIDATGKNVENIWLNFVDRK